MKMGFGGYIVHNNFVYKSSDSQILIYALVVVILAFLFYKRIWATVSTLLSCLMKPGVNILNAQLILHGRCGNCGEGGRYSLLQGYITVNRPRRSHFSAVGRFRNRLKRVGRRLRATKLARIKDWCPRPSPLTGSKSYS